MSKQEIYLGKDGLGELSRLLKNLEAKNIACFTGNKSFNTQSFNKDFLTILQDYKTYFVQNISPNPSAANLELYRKEMAKGDYDVMIAIGGGSVLDSAKIIHFFTETNLTIKDFFQKNLTLNKQNKRPLIAIPTTAGTGSESTQFATFYIANKKYSLDNEWTLPSHVILDPIFGENMPRYIAACTGADALTQAVESHWSCNSTKESTEYSLKAISLLSTHLRKAVLENDGLARLKVIEAANLAGKAIQITRTTACHAISYPMTSYFHVSHGQAVCITLPSFLLFNSNVEEKSAMDRRGAGYTQQRIAEILSALRASSVEEGKDVLQKLISNLGLKTKLKDIGIQKKDLELIVENSFTPSRMQNNPRVVTSEDVMHILTELI